MVVIPIFIFVLIFIPRISYCECIEGDCENGVGKWLFKDGKVYIGKFKDSKRNGKGKQTSKDGIMYDGDWKNDLMDGNGKYIHPKSGNNCHQSHHSPN